VKANVEADDILNPAPIFQPGPMLNAIACPYLNYLVVFAPVDPQLTQDLGLVVNDFACGRII
jgi:hypothetical protein